MQVKNALYVKFFYVAPRVFVLLLYLQYTTALVIMQAKNAQLLN